MSSISRYILGQLLLTFILMLTGITLILALTIMAREGIRQGLGLMAIMQLLPYALPSALRFAVPATILMATCSVYGRMASENEVVAIKAMGITPKVMLLPAFGLAALVSIGVIWLNDIAVTWGADGMRRVFAESVEGVVFRLLRTQRHFNNEHFSIHVKAIHGHKLISPTVVLRGNDPVTVVAREAELKTNLDDRTLSIFLTDCEIRRDRHVLAVPDTIERVIPLSLATKRDRSRQRPSELAMSQLSSEAVRHAAKIRRLEQTMAARAAYQMILGEFDEMGGVAWSELNDQHSQAKSHLNRLHLEPWRRIAEGCSCLFIVIVGAPLAITMRTSNFFTTFASCFFPILCIYYPLLTCAVDRAKDGVWPPYSVWMGNIVLLIMGAWLTRRVIRY